MKIYRHVAIIATQLLSSSVLLAQAQVFPSTNANRLIVIPESEIWQLHAFSDNGHINWDVLGEIYTSTNQSSDTWVGKIKTARGRLQAGSGANHQYPASGSLGALVPGPASILAYSNLQPSLIFHKVHNLEKKSLSSTVVIPESPLENYSIIIEKSTDKVTWLECLPGSYNTSTNRAYFRLRLKPQ